MINIQFYLNPVNKELHINLNESKNNFTVKVYNMTGREMLQKEFKNSKVAVIDFTGFSKEIYQVIVKRDGECFQSNVVRF